MRAACLALAIDAVHRRHDCQADMERRRRSGQLRDRGWLVERAREPARVGYGNRRSVVQRCRTAGIVLCSSARKTPAASDRRPTKWLFSWVRDRDAAGRRLLERSRGMTRIVTLT